LFYYWGWFGEEVNRNNILFSVFTSFFLTLKTLA